MSRRRRSGGAVLENVLLVGLFVACLLGWGRVRYAHEQSSIEDLAPIVAGYLWELDREQAWQGSRVILEAEGYDRLTILDDNGRVFLDMTPSSKSTLERSLRAIGLMPEAVHFAPLVHSREPGSVERIGTLRVEHYVSDLFVYVQLGALLLAVGLFRRGQRQRQALEEEARRLALVEAEATKIQAEARLALRERQLEEKRNLEALGRLAAGVAHDLNNVLTVVFASSELARDMTENPVARRQNDLVISAAERASALTRQLLAFGRRQVMEPRVLDINDVVTAFRPILERAVGDEVRLSVDLDPQLGNVEADPAQIEQVLLNLAVNARDAIDGTGMVEVITRNLEGPGAVPGGAALPAGSWVALAVRDTGSGMDDETLAKAFEPFFTTKGEGEGTGLGLATVYGIVRQSKGELSVASTPGQGTVFTVGLPRTQAQVAERVVEVGVSHVDRRAARILLVDDRDDVREAMARSLAVHGYTVITAGDGLEALTAAAELRSPLDLLVTDLTMPGMSGRELARKLRDQQADLRVLYVSGDARAVLEEGFQSTAFEAVLVKPFGASVLAARVGEMLGAGRDEG